MIEYIANRTVDGLDQAIRFVGVGSFAVLKNGSKIAIPNEATKDPKEVFGDDLDRISEFRTFYHTETKIFTLVEYSKGDEIPDDHVSIPHDGGEIDGWEIGRLEPPEKSED